MSIFILRTTRGREKTVIETLQARMRSDTYDIAAIFHPSEMKGYVFIEGDEAAIERLVTEVPYAKGLMRKPVPVDEIDKFLSEEPEDINLVKGDTVQVVSGPFKDEVGRVERVDEVNREITIELLEAAVPIPLTINAELLRKKENM